MTEPSTERTERAEPPEHRELSELLPWYLNETLEEPQRKRLERHLTSCAVCRADLALERGVQQSLAQASAIEYLPAPALKKLHARLETLARSSGDASAAPAPSAAPEPPCEAPASRRAPPARWRLGALAASLVTALIIAGLAPRPRLHRESRPPGADDTAASYRTVTSATPHAGEATVRAVFTPSVSLLELEKILAEAGLRIVDGPTEAGVYSLAPTSSRPIQESIAALRRHAQVRFAEPTRLESRGSPGADARH